MNTSNALRSIVRAVPPLHWLAGAWRYRQFQQALALAEAEHAAAGAERIPPPKLRHRVHGVLDSHSYVDMGRRTAAQLVSVLREHGLDADHRDVLDFGCGPGRVAVWFKEAFPQTWLQGCDIDSEAITWAQEHLGDIARFAVNSATPPAPYADAAFDLIYSISIFTHLDAAMQDAWLAELHRLLRPGAVLLTTVHGATVRGSVPARDRETLEREGFVFSVHRTGRFKLDGLPDFYQTAFHTRDYIASHWSRWFEIVEHRDAGLHGHHDLLLLRKRSA